MIARLKAFVDPRVSHKGITWIGYALLIIGFSASQVVSSGNLAGMVPGHGTPARTVPHTPTGLVTYGPPISVPAPAARVHATGTILQVHNVYTRDTGQNISGLINYWSDRYGVSPVGVTATLMTESALVTTAWHTPVPGAGPCDYSGGLSQFTICTIAGSPFNVGDGSLSYSNIANVRAWESNPANAIWAAALYLSILHRQVCWDFAELYSSFNQGGGYGCYSSLYEYPQNYWAIQALNNFYGNFAYAQTYYAQYVTPTPPVPAPKPFNWTLWNHYRVTHHERVISPLWHGKTSWAAAVWYQGHEWLGGIKHKDVWFGPTRRRRYGFSKTAFAHGCVFQWNAFRRAKAVHHPC